MVGSGVGDVEGRQWLDSGHILEVRGATAFQTDVVRTVEATRRTPRFIFRAAGGTAALSAEAGKGLSANTKNGAGGTF